LVTARFYDARMARRERDILEHAVPEQAVEADT
jgi:hypothetical protein